MSPKQLQKQAAVTNQPVAQPMAVPTGLDYLKYLDTVLIKQELELLEAFIGFETNNKYQITNSVGQPLLYAVEETNCCCRCCCGKRRSFTIKIMDYLQNTIISVYRPFKCCAGGCWNCCGCCQDCLTVLNSSGQDIGTVQERCSIIRSHYMVHDDAGKPALKIVGPWCDCNICCGDIDYKIKDLATGEQIGKISKQWSGVIKEAFTDTDNFSLTFPVDLNISLKATLLGAVFLIDFMHYENNTKRDKN